MIYRSFIFTCFILAFTLICNLAYADTEKVIVPNNVAIVDMHYLMQETKAAKSIQKQLTALRDRYKDEIADKEKELREGEKSLIERKESLSVEDFKNERLAFEKQVVSVQKEVKEKQSKLDHAFSVAMDQLRSEAVKLIASSAKDRDASLVLPRQNIIIVDQALDMTPEIYKALNETLDHIELKVE